MDLEWVLLGAIGGMLWKIWAPVKSWIKRQFTVEIQVNDYYAKQWIVEWLSYKVNQKIDSYRVLDVFKDDADEDEYGHIRHITNNKPRRRHMSYEKHKPKRVSRAMFTVGQGKHLVWYKARPVWVNRSKEDEDGSKVDTWTLTSFGRDSGFLRSLVVDAEQYYLERREIGLSIHVHDGNGGWYEQSLQNGRPLSSVILKAGQAEQLTADISRFIAKAEDYANLDVPYRRGYLFYGPPGTGKSSLAKALATEFEMDLYVLSLSQAGLTDAAVSQSLSLVGPNSIVLLEDVDAAFDQRKANEDALSKITFSGLVNSLDGVSAGENRILIMTTNHADKLDPALIRPGRADVHVDLGPADADMAARIFDRFYPDNTVSVAFGHKAKGATPAKIQTHLMMDWDTPEQAYEGWS